MKEPLEKLDSCARDSVGLWVELESEVKGRLTPFAWPLVSQKNLWEDASNSRARGSRLSLSPSRSFFPPSSLFLFSWSPPNICLKVKMWKSPEGLGPMTWYAAHMSVHTKPGVDATTRTHAGFSTWQWHSDSLKEAQTKTLPDVCTRLLCPFILSSLTFVPRCPLHCSPHHLSPNVYTPPLLFLSSHWIASAVSRPHQQKKLFSYSRHISGILGCIITKPF